jgi:hypothetical protein
MAAFPLQLGAAQLRVLLVSGNVLLACGLVGAGAWCMVQKRTTSQVNVRDRGDFAPKKIPISKKSGASLIVAVADQMQPKKQQPPAPPPEDTKPKDDVADELVELTEGGPLADGWKYDFYIVDHDDPLSTHITLRKIESKGKAGATSRTSRGRRKSTSRRGTNRSRSGTRAKRGGAKTKPDDVVTFYLKERKFRVPTEEEDYYVDSADQTRFVYWAAKEGPEQLYALVYKEPTIYAQDPEKGLRPDDDEDDDKDKDKEDEADVKFFVTRPYHYEGDLEDEYFQIRSGKLDLEDARLINERAKETEAGKASETKAALRRPPPAKTAPGPTAKRGRPTTTKPAVEAKAEAGSTSPEEAASPDEADKPAPEKEMSKEEGLKEIGNILEEADRAGKLSEKEKEAAKELRKMLEPPRRKAYSGGTDG